MQNLHYMDNDSILCAGTLILFCDVLHGFIYRSRSLPVGQIIGVVPVCDFYEIYSYETVYFYRVGRSLSLSGGVFKIEVLPLFRPLPCMCLSIESSEPKKVEKS